jgi:hypothetical protein
VGPACQSHYPNSSALIACSASRPRHRHHFPLVVSAVLPPPSTTSRNYKRRAPPSRAFHLASSRTASALLCTALLPTALFTGEPTTAASCSRLTPTTSCAAIDLGPCPTLSDRPATVISVRSDRRQGLLWCRPPPPTTWLDRHRLKLRLCTVPLHDQFIGHLDPSTSPAMSFPLVEPRRCGTTPFGERTLPTKPH